MRSKEGLFLLIILFILVVLCNTGFGLECYSCIDPVSSCNVTIKCSSLFDACAIAVAGPRKYHLCYNFVDCNREFLSKTLGEKDLQCRCCRKDLCNLHLNETEGDKEKEKEKEKEKGGTVSLSGKTVLLVMLVLVTSWNCFL